MPVESKNEIEVYKKPRISTLKIILIIIALIITLFFVFFLYSGLVYTSAVSKFAEISEQTTEETSSVTERLQKSISIELFECTPGEPGTVRFVIRNTGTLTIDSSELSVVFDSEPISVEFSSLPQGSFSNELSLSRYVEPGSHTLMVLAPAGDRTMTTSC